MKKFTLKQALEVAKKDYDVGISYAIDCLNEMGFDCSMYYDFLNNLNTNDIDAYEQNIEARDKLYEHLGIMETMEKAYSKVWR